jgi:polysaccharide pyruvyl transferase WcaK-like protein
MSSGEVAGEIGGLDLFVLGGGGLLYDGEARHYVREVRIARDLGVPVMTWAIGAGPLELDEDRRAVRRALNRAGAIMVRDERDRHLLHDVGVAHEVSVTADPAFLMERRPFTQEMLWREGIEPGSRLIGVSVREPGPAAPGLDARRYHSFLSVLANAVDLLVERTGAAVVFVPMERGTRDIQHAFEVASMMSFAENVRVLHEEYDAGQVLGFMRHLEFAVGMRLHFLLFAALSGVPFVPLPYASKVEGLAYRLGMPALPLREIGAGRLPEFVSRAWDGRDTLRSRLEERLPSLREHAGQSPDLAADLLSVRRVALGS